MAEKKSGLILGLLGKPDKPMTEDDEEMGSKSMAAQAVLDAIADNDADALADAMQTMVSTCSSPMDEE